MVANDHQTALGGANTPPMNKNVIELTASKGLVDDPLTEIIRAGARRLLESALKVEGAETYPFGRIPQVSVLPLEESNMRLFTFQVTLDQNRTIQYGYLQFTDAPAAYRVLRLNKDYPLDLMQRSFTAKDWIGAV